MTKIGKFIIQAVITSMVKLIVAGLGSVLLAWFGEFTKQDYYLFGFVVLYILADVGVSQWKKEKQDEKEAIKISEAKEAREKLESEQKREYYRMRLIEKFIYIMYQKTEKEETKEALTGAYKGIIQNISEELNMSEPNAKSFLGSYIEVIESKR